MCEPEVVEGLLSDEWMSKYENDDLKKRKSFYYHKLVPMFCFIDEKLYYDLLASLTSNKEIYIFRCLA
jgi:hypothetical protein